MTNSSLAAMAEQGVLSKFRFGDDYLLFLEDFEGLLITLAHPEEQEMQLPLVNYSFRNVHDQRARKLCSSRAMTSFLSHPIGLGRSNITISYYSPDRHGSRKGEIAEEMRSFRYSPAMTEILGQFEGIEGLVEDGAVRALTNHHGDLDTVRRYKRILLSDGSAEKVSPDRFELL